MRGVTGRIVEARITKTFLLTRLMRGVTPFVPFILLHLVYFYSHASCEA